MSADALLDIVCRLGEHRPGRWVPAGVLADVAGLRVAEVAALLRGAQRQGLCESRHSLIHAATSWRVRCGFHDPRGVTASVVLRRGHVR